MLHGLLTGSLATWYFTAGPVLARTRHVHLYDLRGHGRSERTTHGYDCQTMVADLKSLVDQSASQVIDLVGHSYGALIALHFALMYPTQVRRLVLVELPLPPSRIDDVQTFLKQTPHEMVQALPKSLQDVMGLQGRGRRARRFLESIQFLTQSSSLLNDLRQEPDVPDAVLQQIRCPVLGLFGRESICAQVGERLHATVPNFTHHRLDGGHYLPLDAGTDVSRALVEFLDG